MTGSLLDAARMIRRRRLHVWGLVAVYLTVVAWHISTRGIPLEREQVLAWLLALVIVVSLGRGAPIADIGRAVRDWSILAVLFIAYDYSRGAADWFDMPLQVEMPIVIDRALFPGDVPTVELQARYGPFEGTRWWEAGVAVVYLSFFVVPHTITAWLWLRDRSRWRSWLGRYAGVTMLGLAGYILVPTVPPWMASRRGEIGPVERVTSRGWRLLDLDITEQLVDKGQAAVNLTAAFPSLHAAYPALIAAFFWSSAGPVRRIVLAAYPLAMGFSLVIGGEHYVTDVLAGWLVVGIAMLGWQRLEAVPAVNRWRES